jgi:hypothetical protein
MIANMKDKRQRDSKKRAIFPFFNNLEAVGGAVAFF